MPLKTLFLNPPSFENFDGGAGSRWPATREIESYWYPVWLAYPAGMLEGARLLDAPPHYVSADETIKIAQDYEFLVLFTAKNLITPLSSTHRASRWKKLSEFLTARMARWCTTPIDHRLRISMPCHM